MFRTMNEIWMDKVATRGSLPSGVAVAMALKAALHLDLLQWGCASASTGLRLGAIRA